MSTIQNTILQQRLKKIIPFIPKEYKSIENSYAFLLFSMMSILGIDIDEAILNSTEGYGDGGIDAIYIDQTEKDIIIHIFQSKFKIDPLKGGLGKNEIDLTIAKVEEIFRGDEMLNQSPKIKAKIDEIRDTIQEFGAIKMPSVNIYFVTNGKLPSEDEKERAKILEERGSYKVYYFSTSDIFNLTDDRSKKTYTINIKTEKNLVSQNIGNIKGLITTISADQLVKLYDEAGRDRVLEKNIRGYLGNNNINKKIKETAESEKESAYFWFLNNGVSIVCDYFEYADDAKGNHIIKLKNPTIVNGGQTTKTLYELNKQPSLFDKTRNKVFLLARIYETENEDVIRKITEGTNSQNPTCVRDLKANDKIQNLVKQYFSQNGFFLETKRHEYDNERIDKIVKNDSVFQAYLSLYKAIPHKAKSSKSGVFESNFAYIFVVTNHMLPQEFFRSFELLKFVQNQEKKSTITNGEAYLPHATFAIIFVMGELEERIKNIQNPLTQKIMLTVYKNANVIIKEMIKAEKVRLQDAYSHNKFFKSSTVVDLINKYKKPKIKSAK